MISLVVLLEKATARRRGAPIQVSFQRSSVSDAPPAEGLASAGCALNLERQSVRADWEGGPRPSGSKLNGGRKQRCAPC